MAQLEEQAREELAVAMVLTPEDLLSDIGPLGEVLYLNQLAWYVLRAMTGMLSSDASAELESDDPPVIALNQLTMAVGMLDQVCVTLGILPEEVKTPQ